MLAILLHGTVHRTLAADITVFAAASTGNALSEVAAEFESETGHSVRLSLAGSAVLARQIHLGAPADLFISANPQWMDWLADRDLLESDSRFDLLGNRLVLIGHGRDRNSRPVTSALDLNGMLGDGRIAMALTESVPAGMYGKAALRNLGLWEQVEDRIAQADNVRAALAFVARGEAPLGIVYRTDAGAQDNVSVLGLFPASSHPPIIYPVALIAGRDTAPNREFLMFLRGAPSRGIFARHGFSVIAR